MKRLLQFSAAHVDVEHGAPNPSRLVKGNPKFETRNFYTDPTGQFFSGTWSAGVGAWRVVYDAHEEEFCQLLAGEALLTDAQGTQTHLHAGEAFVIPGGFTGTWENLTPVTKHYAIMLLKETS
jgi:uncharacterized protein